MILSYDLVKCLNVHLVHCGDGRDIKKSYFIFDVELSNDAQRFRLRFKRLQKQLSFRSLVARLTQLN